MSPRTALITGASRGIGRHLALGFAEAGIDLGLMATSADALVPVVEEIGGRVRVVPVAGDVAREVDVVRAVDEVARQLGSIDVLVNNAGASTRRSPCGRRTPTSGGTSCASTSAGPSSSPTPSSP